MSEIRPNPHPITTSGTRLTLTGTWRAFHPSYVQFTSPCRESCPAGEDVARWTDLLRAGRNQEAWAILTEDNPFPATLGRICPHPCEANCNRGQHDQPVAIHGLERFLGDRALAEGWAFPLPAGQRQERVAVVGGGPAGLSCAYQLRRLGYPVTILEARDTIGGNLCYALPSYQLPAPVAEAEIQRIVDLGVDVLTGVRVGVDRTWDQLRQEFAAVFVATGATVIPGPDLPGQDRPGVQDGLTFLERVRGGDRELHAAVAVVIGAGQTGIESARTLRRLGASVTLVARESLDRSVLSDQLAQARSDGVVVVAPAQVEAILGGPRVTGVRLRDRDLAADTVILATGRMADLETLPADAEVDARLNLVANPFTGSTAMEGVFAGGDVTGTRHAVEAVGAGKRAAAAIHAYLGGRDLAEALGSARLGHSPNLSMRAYTRQESYPDHLQVNLKRVVTYAEIETLYFPKDKRVEPPAAEGLPSFNESCPAFTESEALVESRRCFNCGTCIGCDNCFVFCPDTAIKKRPDGYGYTVDWDYCKGCGVCVNECPREALVLEEEVK